MKVYNWLNWKSKAHTLYIINNQLKIKYARLRAKSVHFDLDMVSNKYVLLLLCRCFLLTYLISFCTQWVMITARHIGTYCTFPLRCVIGVGIIC